MRGEQRGEVQGREQIAVRDQEVLVQCVEAAGDGAGSAERALFERVVDGEAQARARYAGSDASSVGAMERLENAVRQAVLSRRLEAAGLDPERVQALTQIRLQFETERITDRGRGGSGRGGASTSWVEATVAMRR